MKEARTAHNGLGITEWRVEPGEPLDSEKLDVFGVMVAAWWPSPARGAPLAGMEVETLFANVWPSGSASFKHVSEPDGRCGHQEFVFIRIRQHPVASWKEVLTESLKLFTDRGAVIAWAGGYECFVCYSPETKFEGCYAVYTSKGGLACLSDLDEPLIYISEDAQLIGRLHAIVADEVHSFRGGREARL